MVSRVANGQHHFDFPDRNFMRYQKGLSFSRLRFHVSMKIFDHLPYKSIDRKSGTS